MSDPIKEFSLWFDEAKKHPHIKEPTAMSLATASSDGKPSSRVVLLKAFDENGFVFYTNLESRKSLELKHNPYAALCFHWMPIEKQIRIEGNVEQVSDVEADAYFATRERGKQIGAWASKQSRKLENRALLLDDIERITAKYVGVTIPRPPFWSGWRVVPERIEFWSQGEFRLHEREIYSRQGNGWEISKLYP